jgi:hypothetical protein
MIQTGDPTGLGKGGQSIWGEYFPVIDFIFIYLSNYIFSI